MKELNHRDNLGRFLNSLNLVGEGVEVGVAWAGYSRQILSQWKGRKLWLVDPHEDYPDYKEDTTLMQLDLYPEGVWRWIISEQPNRAALIPFHSIQAAPLFRSESLDFVYIDGNHSYKHTMLDLDAWHSKVKPGGIVAGHDYLNKLDEGWHCEVKRAVDDWIKEPQIDLKVTPDLTWYYFK